MGTGWSALDQKHLLEYEEVSPCLFVSTEAPVGRVAKAIDIGKRVMKKILDNDHSEGKTANFPFDAVVQKNRIVKPMRARQS
jgi:hypothetical protein